MIPHATTADVLAGRSPWAVVPGDCVAGMRTLPDGCVHCCVTSPPFYALRDYGVEGQIGLEGTPEEFVAKLVGVFREVRRVLRADGTTWVNLGDTYANDVKSANGKPGPAIDGAPNQPPVPKNWRGSGLKKKDLIGVPWMLAFALRADGWYLRQDIIWHKPSPMPSSVRDRCTTAHEYLFLLTKSPRYFFDADAIAVPAKTAGQPIAFPAGFTPAETGAPHTAIAQQGRGGSIPRNAIQPPTANKRSVWKIAARSYKGAHFATFPPKLVEPCVLAGTSAKGVCPACGEPWVRVVEKERKATRPGKDTKVTAKMAGDVATAEANGWNRANAIGNRDPERHCTTTKTLGWKAGCDCDAGEPVPAVVLDPFAGSGTTLAVAVDHGRRAIGCELNRDYLPLVTARMRNVCPPLFGSTEATR